MKIITFLLLFLTAIPTIEASDKRYELINICKRTNNFSECMKKFDTDRKVNKVNLPVKIKVIPYRVNTYEYD